MADKDVPPMSLIGNLKMERDALTARIEALESKDQGRINKIAKAIYDYFDPSNPAPYDCKCCSACSTNGDKYFTCARLVLEALDAQS
jgi:hypothetical protein